MKFSTFTLSQVPDSERTVEFLDDQFNQFILAEKLGFSTVWIAEHLFSTHGTFSSTQVLAGAIARATTTIRIGTAVSIVAFNHPLRTASDFAAIDCMSHGRLNYGTGRAYQVAEFEALGLDMSKSRDLYRESLDIILKSWSGEPFTYEGQFWTIPKPVRVYPRLVQQPRPPIYTAANSRESFIEAGQQGFHVLTSATFAWLGKGRDWVEDLASNLEAYDRACQEAGHDPKKMERALMMSCHVAPSAEAAEQKYGPCIDWSMRGHAKRAQTDGSLTASGSPQASNWGFEGLKAAGAVLVGDAESAVRHIRHLKKRLGFTELILEFNRGGLPNRDVEAAMHLFMERVAPNAG